MTDPTSTEVDPYTDALVDQTDNAAEEGQPDPPQDPDWRPWSDGPAGS